MPRIPLCSSTLGLLALVIVGCSDDSVGTADGTAGASSSSSSATGTEPGSSTQVEPTTTGASSSGSGMTEAMTSTTGTTEPVDPTTDPTTGTTEPVDPSTTGSTSGETTSAESSSTGDEVCPEGTIICEREVAKVCDGMGGFSSEETCHECIDGVGCTAECSLPMPEVCDGLDNDCDGVADGPDVCPAASCFGGGEPCLELPIPQDEPQLISGCAQPFPPAQGLPCPIDNPGPQFHVSAATGNDANDGKTPETAWKTLCHAVEAAPDGSTLRVAEGKYAPASVYIGKALTVKGGYAADFVDWDPDAHPTTFYGRLTLDHNSAVFGGFRMISNPLLADNWSYAHHFVGAGTLVRNYIEIVATEGSDPDILNFYGIIAAACDEGVSVLRCNDIYIKSTAPQTFVLSGIEYGNHALHAGKGVIDANHICIDGGGFASEAIGGYGACSPGPVSVLMRNNVIEKTGFGGQAIEFYSCGTDDMDITLTNNTILSGGRGVNGYGDPAATLRWKLTNNIVFSPGGGQEAVNVGDPNVEIVSSEGNLTFGFANNGVSPPPLMTAGDDLSGVATPASVFVAPNTGDFHLKPAGQGAGTGLNVYGLPEYGTVKFDLDQKPRPPMGQWDRGALAQ